MRSPEIRRGARNMMGTIWMLVPSADSFLTSADDDEKPISTLLDAAAMTIVESASTGQEAGKTGIVWQLADQDEPTLFSRLQAGLPANDVAIIPATVAERWLSQQALLAPRSAAKRKQGVRHKLPAGVIIWSPAASLSAEAAISWFHRNAADVVLINDSDDVASISKSLRQAVRRAARWQQMVTMGEHLLAENQQLQSQQKTLEQDQAEGRALQQRLMPAEAVQYEGVKVEYLNRPVLSLSGDFIDHFAIDADTFGFYLADVSGHGVSAAIVTALLKSFFARYQSFAEAGKSQRIRDPGRLATQLNQQLLMSALDKHMVLFYGVYHRPSRELRYINAGLCPTPSLKNNGIWLPLSVASKPVGLYADESYVATTVTLSTQFQLMIYSDGWIDCFSCSGNHEKMTEIQQQFQDVFDRYAGQPLSEILRHLPLDDRQQSDDLSLLSLRQSS